MSSKHWVTMTPAAPSASSRHTRVEPGHKTRSAKATPPIAIACPDRFSPRSRTSANEATTMVPEHHEKEDRRPHGGHDEKPVGFAERRAEHQQIDEVAAGEGAGQASRHRAVGGLPAILGPAAEHERGRAPNRHGGGHPPRRWPP